MTILLVVAEKTYLSETNSQPIKNLTNMNKEDISLLSDAISQRIIEECEHADLGFEESMLAAMVASTCVSWGILTEKLDMDAPAARQHLISVFMNALEPCFAYTTDEDKAMREFKKIINPNNQKS